MADETAVQLDLIPPELVRPRIKKAMLAAIGVGIVLAVILLQFLTWPVAIAIALGLTGPVVLSIFIAMRRSATISGSTLSIRAGVTRTIDLDDVGYAELVVRSGRVTQVTLNVDGIHVPLAIYVGEGGREIPIQGISTLAASLAERFPDLSEVLTAQLRAEAIGAGIERRPLYRAAALAAGSRRAMTLSDEQISELAD